MKLNILVLEFLFLVISLTSGLSNNLYFKHYSNKQGLSHNTVYCSIQDKRGFMWFGTDEGLNRFDGQTFKIYKHNQKDPNSIPSNKILSVFEDSQGKLWVCTDKGLCYYLFQENKFIPMSFKLEKDFLNRFFTVKEDLSKNLWLLSNNSFLKYSLETKKAIYFSNDKYFNPTSISIASAGEVWFSGYDCIYLYMPKTNNFIKYPILSETEKKLQIGITTIQYVSDQEILVGTNKSGLLIFNPKDSSLHSIIKDTRIREIRQYNKEEYWIASESGIYIYNKTNRSVSNLRKSLTDQYSISDNAIYSLTVDREGGMWIGSFFGGINYLPKEYIRFNKFIGGRTYSQMLGNAIREICVDHYGNLWLGTEDNGIDKFNPQTGEMKNFSLNNQQYPLSSTNIHGLMVDGNNLWVGSFENGIEILDIPSGKTIKRYSIKDKRSNLNNDFVLCFYKTKKKEILVGTAYGVQIYNPETDNFSSWNNLNTLSRQIYEDKSGDIWIASSDGLYRYQTSNESLVRYQKQSDDPNSIGNNDITSVFESSSGQIWITTVDGLYLFNHEKVNFRRMIAEDRLPSNILYRILEDSAKNLWISSANGLVKFTPQTNKIKVYSYSDGLHEIQFNFCSSYKTPSGEMWFGTINGLMSFTPEHFKKDLFVPPIYITDLRLTQNKENTLSDLVHVPIEETDTVTLPYNLSSFTLSFVALSFTLPEEIQYAYMLQGIDNNWVTMNRNNSVSFANMAPGKYIFKVRSTNSSGEWQNNIKTLYIIVNPPFWATGWAYAFYLILIGASIILFFNYKKAKFEEKHIINQKIFEGLKEKELYDAKIQFFTFITHEIRTPLTLIKAPLDKIIRSNDGTADTKENLHIIEKNTQRLLELSNQLLDFKKTDSKGFKLNFVKTDLILLMKDIIKQFSSSINQSNKEFSIQMPQEYLNACLDREAITKITSNLLTNAFKYSNKYIAFQLLISEKENQFSISVINDGRLVPEAETNKIFEPFYRLKESENILGSGMGLSLSRMLAELHNATLSYSYTPNHMNMFRLTVPIKQDSSYELIEEDFTIEENLTQAIDLSQTKKYTLLIVEDQKDLRQYIAKELAPDYTIYEAFNGKEAIDLLNKHLIHVIVSDIMMPQMDGFELCLQVKNDINFSHIPFILLTAQHNMQSRMDGLNNGADAYLEKPFTIELLYAQIKNLLKSRESLFKAYLEKPFTQTLSLSATSIDNVFLEKINAFIDRNITNDLLNVELLANEMQMSTSSLYRKVKGISGLSPVDFIKIARLKKAVLLIKNGETRINEIAYKSGFSSPSYFSTCFQKQFGISPSDSISNEQKGNIGTDY